MENFSAAEEHILDIIQSDFPLTVRPYSAIGRIVGENEDEVLNILQSLKTRNIIRQISAIFNGKFLGFNTALISFQLPEQALENAARIVNAHPGVSHNYQREHPFNLWFTLSVPDELNLEQHVRTLARRASCACFLYLPGVKTFKRRVQFELNTRQKKATPMFQPVEEQSTRHGKITLPEKIQNGIMQELQQDLPLSLTPFTDIARRFQIETETLFDFLAYLQTSQRMNRFAGIVRHRQLGFTANAMVVWNVPVETVEAFGQYASEKSAISHCYERVTYPEWPYNLYTMIHGQSQSEPQSIIDELAEKFSLTDYQILYSSREFKKQRVNYFNNAIHAWHKKWVEKRNS